MGSTFKDPATLSGQTFKLDSSRLQRPKPIAYNVRLAATAADRN